MGESFPGLKVHTPSTGVSADLDDDEAHPLAGPLGTGHRQETRLGLSAQLKPPAVHPSSLPSGVQAPQGLLLAVRGTNVQVKVVQGFGGARPQLQPHLRQVRQTQVLRHFASEPVRVPNLRQEARLAGQVALRDEGGGPDHHLLGEALAHEHRLLAGGGDHHFPILPAVTAAAQREGDFPRAHARKSPFQKIACEQQASPP